MKREHKGDVAIQELKPEFGTDSCLFGGFQGLDKFMRVHAAPNCSDQKFVKASALVGSFSSSMMGLLGKLVHHFTSMDDEGSAELSCHLETCIRGLSSAIDNTARTPPSALPSRKKSPGKQLVYESYTNNQSQGGGDDDNGNSDDDADCQIVYSAQAGPYDDSGSGAAYVDAQHSATVNADVSANRAENDGGTPTPVGNEPVLESEIMLSETSRMASADGGEGMLCLPDMTNTHVEVATKSSLKRCIAFPVKAFGRTYTRRKKLRVPSPPPQVAPVHPALLSEAEMDYHIKSIDVKELGIQFPDKGTGETIPPPSQKKQDSPRSPVSTPMDDGSCDMIPRKKKIKKAVRKVKKRTHPQFRATSSQLPQEGVVDIEEPAMVISPNEAAQAGVMGSPASAEVVDQLAKGTTITTIVEDLVDFSK